MSAPSSSFPGERAARTPFNIYSRPSQNVEQIESAVDNRSPRERKQRAAELPAINLNHVSINATDLAESERFYSELFGMTSVPTPNFGFPVRWLRVGELQLHLFARPSDPGRYHHFALTVDDFADVYRRARRLDIFERERFGHHLYELPSDTAQLYLRDPAGNLVEVDAPRASHLPADIRADMRLLSEAHPQDQTNRKATLFLNPPRTGASPADTP
jgi:catechol 2,3-dioxygenase-like lactoylglutathione lyase family enzyme